MGLKTENYVSKSTGLVLPTAYAKIRTCMLDEDDNLHVTFGIHTSRENLENEKLKPIETIELNSRLIGYKVNRNNPWQEEAYNMAKTEARKGVRVDEKRKLVPEMKYGALYGWQDDIVQK